MSLSTPAISILTPVWNGLPYIKECVESVFSQEFQDWELIISDNGSTDGTRDYLDTLTDKRVQIFKQEKNLGIDGNLNFLFSKATATICYCLCADDYFYPGGLQRVMDEWSIVPPETAFIGFNWKEVLKHDILARYSYEVLPKNLNPAKSQLGFFLFGNLVGNLSNVSCKVDIVKSSGGFDEGFKMAGDFEIWARIARTNHMVLSDTETVFVRRHEGVASIYLNKQGRLFGEHITIYERLIKDLSPSFGSEKLINRFNIEICSFHLRESLIALLKGRLANIKMYLNIQSSIIWPKWKRFFVCLPFALFETGREYLLVRMARDMMNKSN